MAMSVLLWVEARRGLGHFRIASALLDSLTRFGAAVDVTTSRPDVIEFFAAPAEADRVLPVAVDQWDLPFRPSAGRDVASERDFLRKVRDLRPDAIVLEMWPMRRGIFDDEIVQALSALRRVHPAARVYSVLREIDGAPPDKPLPRHAVGAALLEEFADAVLIRGDGRIRLEETWPDIAGVADRLRYVGYFGPLTAGQSCPAPRGSDWVFAMGGGWFERAGCLASIVAEIHAARAPADSVCRFFLPEQALLAAVPSKSERIDVHGISRRFIGDLQHAALAILQAGYNSIVEALGLGVPAVFFVAQNDYTAGEQRHRLSRLAEMGLMGEGTPWQWCDDMSASGLSRAIDAALRGTLPAGMLQFGGERRAAQIIVGAEERR
jgi:predicted glycosyltransferase